MARYKIYTLLIISTLTLCRCDRITTPTSPNEDLVLWYNAPATIWEEYLPLGNGRMYQLVGTEGYANKYPVQGYTFKLDQLRSIDEGAMPDIEDLNHHTFAPSEVAKEMTAKYKHPVQLQFVDGVHLQEYSLSIGGHGGMDFIMDYRLVYCLRNGLPLDMDVYDAAEWSSMGELTHISIENGSKPVKIPDFTRGNWDRVDGLTFYFAE